MNLDDTNIFYLWLQMHWYRQCLTIPEHKAWLPSLTSYHHLRFAYCCKVLGYHRTDNDSLICQECYDRVPDFYKAHLVAPFLSHFISDGIIRPAISCVICFKNLLTRRTLYECDLCQRGHLQFLTREERNDRNIEDSEEQTLLQIDGIPSELTI